MKEEIEKEKETSCKHCGGTGERLKGYFDDNNELVVTKRELCICQQD